MLAACCPRARRGACSIEIFSPDTQGEVGIRFKELVEDGFEGFAALLAFYEGAP